MIDVTLPLTESLVEDAKRFGNATQRDMIEVLAEALEMMWATIAPLMEVEPPLSTLADEEVLAIANSKMDLEQNQRLGELQAKGKSKDLSAVERTELLALLHVYQTGQLRKSQGANGVVRAAHAGFKPNRSR